MKDKPPVYALYLGHGSVTKDKYDDRLSGEIKIHVVVIAEGLKIRNPSHGTYGDGSKFDDFYFRAYWSVKDGVPEAPYGYEAVYDKAFSVDLTKAERMVKLLRKVRAAKLPVNPTTFGQYCTLLASALGIKMFVKQDERGNGYGWSYDDNKHTILPITSAQYAIDGEIEAVQKTQTEVRA